MNSRVINVALADENGTLALLVARLIHHHSVGSPYYNPNHTIKDLAEIDLRASLLRVSSYSRLMDLESLLSPAPGAIGFLAHLQVGDRRVNQYVFMDTGSSLLWVNCVPCVFTAPEPLYDPKQSSTYKPVDCDSDYCGGIGVVGVTCDRMQRCGYTLTYKSEQRAGGHLARESFTFGSHTRYMWKTNVQVVEDVVFGCARRSSLSSSNGVLGLATNKVSLLTQLPSSKFSYCIGHVSDITHSDNTLIIGNRVKLMRNQVPLIVQDKYFIDLKSIKFGDTLLDIDPQILRRNPNDYTGGMLVDTGSSFSFLRDPAYARFEAEIESIIDDSLVRNHSFPWKDYTRFCYNGVFNEDLDEFPVVKYEFNGGIEMEFLRENLFQQVDEKVFCLAILPSEMAAGMPFSLLGILMQQGHYITYDLAAMMFSFERMSCSDIDDYIHDEL